MTPAEIAKLPTEPLYRRKYDAMHFAHLSQDDLEDDEAREAEVFNMGIRVAAHLAFQAGNPSLAREILKAMRVVL